MNVLITGGAGFIGSHVVDKLRDQGINVLIYDLSGVQRKIHRDDVTFIPGSILDMESLRVAMSGVDAVFHLAAVADVKDVFEDPVYSEAINVRGSINVLEAARRAGVKRVIYGSTTWVYSEAPTDEVDEGSPLGAPTHLYTATKLTAEYYCQCYSKLYGLETTVLRYGIPYGPRARDGAVIPIFVNKTLNDEPLTIAGDGSQFRKFVYVEDLAKGNVAALKPIAANKIYNLDGQEKITSLQIAETVHRVLGTGEIIHTEARPGDFSGKEVNSQLAADELGWTPQTSFEEGVRRYIEWFQQRADSRRIELAKVDKSLL